MEALVGGAMQMKPGDWVTWGLEDFFLKTTKVPEGEVEREGSGIIWGGVPLILTQAEFLLETAPHSTGSVTPR